MKNRPCDGFLTFYGAYRFAAYLRKSIFVKIPEPSKKRKRLFPEKAFAQSGELMLSEKLLVCEKCTIEKSGKKIERRRKGRKK